MPASSYNCVACSTASGAVWHERCTAAATRPAGSHVQRSLHFCGLRHELHDNAGGVRPRRSLLVSNLVHLADAQLQHPDAGADPIVGLLDLPALAWASAGPCPAHIVAGRRQHTFLDMAWASAWHMNASSMLLPVSLPHSSCVGQLGCGCHTNAHTCARRPLAHLCCHQHELVLAVGNGVYGHAGQPREEVCGVLQLRLPLGPPPKGQGLRMHACGPACCWWARCVPAG